MDHAEAIPDIPGAQERGRSLRQELADTVDFTSDDGGKKTPAYCPPQDTDLRIRDRYAVCQIVLELADRCPDPETKAVSLLGVAKSGEGAAPWLTLKSLKDAVAPQKPQPPTPVFDLTIETARTSFEGRLLADNGLFHLVNPKGKCAIEIYRFDQRVTIDLDDTATRPLEAVAPVSDPSGDGGAPRGRTFSSRARVPAPRAHRSLFWGFDNRAAPPRPGPPPAAAATRNKHHPPPPPAAEK